ncbi:MAG: ribosome-associated translation inhibitor RaiA [Dehalococcoidia bacterium]|nr:ribosome-associated translation inhibitor RaiA [Dehalococcoidia bacterium]
MDLRVTSKNVEISELERQYLEKKLGRLTHHLPNISESTVEITREKTKEPQDRFVVQVTVNSRGTLLRGEVRAPVLTAAIDSVADVLDRQIERFKGRRHGKGRREGERFEEPAGESTDEAEDTARLVKTKHFNVKPMAVDEAIEQMELLGHEFFIFVSTNNNRFNVVYRRRDGQYGLIEPELG